MIGGTPGGPEADAAAQARDDVYRLVALLWQLDRLHHPVAALEPGAFRVATDPPDLLPPTGVPGMAGDGGPGGAAPTWTPQPPRRPERPLPPVGTAWVEPAAVKAPGPALAGSRVAPSPTPTGGQAEPPERPGLRPAASADPASGRRDSSGAAPPAVRGRSAPAESGGPIGAGREPSGVRTDEPPAPVPRDPGPEPVPSRPAAPRARSHERPAPDGRPGRDAVDRAADRGGAARAGVRAADGAIGPYGDRGRDGDIAPDGDDGPDGDDRRGRTAAGVDEKSGPGTPRRPGAPDTAAPPDAVPDRRPPHPPAGPMVTAERAVRPDPVAAPAPDDGREGVLIVATGEFSPDGSPTAAGPSSDGDGEPAGADLGDDGWADDLLPDAEGRRRDVTVLRRGGQAGSLSRAQAARLEQELRRRFLDRSSGGAP